jgi:hypothetical protein
MTEHLHSRKLHRGGTHLLGQKTRCQKKKFRPDGRTNQLLVAGLNTGVPLVIPSRKRGIGYPNSTVHYNRVIAVSHQEPLGGSSGMQSQVAPHQILGVVALRWLASGYGMTSYPSILYSFILDCRATSYRMPEEPPGGSWWLTAKPLIMTYELEAHESFRDNALTV